VIVQNKVREYGTLAQEVNMDMLYEMAIKWPLTLCPPSICLMLVVNVIPVEYERYTTEVLSLRLQYGLI
jgi:hypothetical protein